MNHFVKMHYNVPPMKGHLPLKVTFAKVPLKDRPEGSDSSRPIYFYHFVAMYMTMIVAKIMIMW